MTDGHVFIVGTGSICDAPLYIRVVDKPASNQRLERPLELRIAGLASNLRSQKTEKLAEYDDRYRMRQGSCRIVYFGDDSRREVTIFKVGNRKDVYR